MAERKLNFRMEPIPESVMLAAVGVLSTMPHFQYSEVSVAGLQTALHAMMPNPEALHYTVVEAASRWKKWMGLAELRGILTWKYPARDGIDADCHETVGLRAEDADRVIAQQDLERSTRLVEAAKAAALLEAGPDEFTAGLIKELTSGKDWPK